MQIIKKIIFTALLVLFVASIAMTQGTTKVEFGKNRVQYHDFDWWEYETKNVVVYWYQGGRTIGETVVQMAEMDFEEVRQLLEYRINEKIEILVFNDITDLKQSNVGNDEILINASGVTKIVDNKLFVYFNGNHNDLRRQIREGIANVYLNYMMFGDNIQEIVQNAVLLNLPTWYTYGLASYAGEEWNVESDNLLRDGIATGEYTNFMDVVESNPQLAGHSFWYFIAQNYGKSTVSNLLYLTRINRSVESGFLYVLGGSFNQTAENWFNFYKQRYDAEVSLGNALDENQRLAIKNRFDARVNNVKISPDGKKLAFVSNEIGKYKVHIQNLEDNSEEIIFKGGQRNVFQSTDYDYPTLAWSPNGRVLGIIYEKRDELELILHDFRTGEDEKVNIPNQYQRIFKAEFIDNRDMLFTAMNNGFSDIYIFDTKTTQSRAITRDYHDDLDATIVNIDGKKGVVFASNRTDSLLRNQKLDTLLPLNTFDLYYYNLEDKDNKVLVQLTETPYTNERHPVAIDERYFGFISDFSGILNRYVGYIDTVFAYDEKVVRLVTDEEIVIPLDSNYVTSPENIDTVFIRSVYLPKGFSYANTKYNRNILEHHVASESGKMAELFYNNGEYQFYIKDINQEQKVLPQLTTLKVIEKRRLSRQLSALKKTKEQKEEPKQPEELTPDKTRKPTLNEVDTVPVDLPDSLPAEKQDTGKIDIDNYFFQSEFEDAPATPAPKKVVTTDKKDNSVRVQKTKKTAVTEQKDPPKVAKFRPSRIVPYRLKFKTDFVTTQLDNSLMFGGLQPIGTQNQFFDYPVPNILMMGSVEDIFEDYRLQGGIRIPVTFNGIEYFGMFYDLKKQLDKRYAFYRRMRKGTSILELPTLPTPYEATYKIISNIAEYQLKYPLDMFQSVRATVTGRTDRQLFLATDFIGLGLPDETQQRLGLRLEYVYDNTLDVSMNMKNGTRAKVYSEIQQRFNLNFENGFSFSANEGTMGILGLDARHYQRLDRHSIIAVRLAASTTFGSDKILYYLGGVDSWLSPKYNTNIPVPQSEDFVYQTVAVNMRGFRSNIRNGNSFALVNAELRVPIMHYFSRGEVSNTFLRNFQVTGFFDVGSAWEGLSPFNEDNPLNTITVQNPNTPISVKVNYFRNPIVAGYGFGLRSVLFGYFVKMDYAWGVETGVVQDRMIYLSLGLDF